MAETWGMAPDNSAPATRKPDGEVKARVKHTCPACGGEAVWNPGKQVLACAFCGTDASVAKPLATGAWLGVSRSNNCPTSASDRPRL